MELKQIQKTYAEYWGVYWRITHRHTIPGIFQWDKNLVTLIEKSCGLTPGMRILDLGCAGGDQARVFARRGYRVTGIDFVPDLIEYARKSFKEEVLEGEFELMDMRKIPWEKEFDACVMLSGSFGFFDDHENSSLLGSISRALKPGGALFLNYLPVESMAQREMTRQWTYIDDGYSLREEWYDSATSSYRTTNRHIMNNGTIIEPVDEEGYHANETIRCYSLKELETMLTSKEITPEEWLPRQCINDPEYRPRPWDVMNSVAARNRQ